MLLNPERCVEKRSSENGRVCVFAAGGDHFSVVEPRMGKGTFKPPQRVSQFQAEQPQLS